MSKMRKMLWSKLRLSSRKKGRHGKEYVNSLKRKPSVNQEYKDAFRTKSYTELSDKAQNQLEIRKCLDKGPYSPSHTNPIHLSEYLLEPPQETLTSIVESSDLHRFLLDFFDISKEAFRIYETILQNVHQVGINYRGIKSVTKSNEQYPDCTNWTHDQYNALYRKLASFALRENPFSSITPEKFPELHNSHVDLLHQLTSQCRKTKRRTRFIRYIKRSLATFLVVGSGALAVTLLVLAMHSMVGMVAAPGLVVCCLGLFMSKKLKRRKRESKRTGLGEQLETAARGMYIIMKDFDTMGQLVKRLNDEMEHKKFAADICAKKRKNGTLEEVVREFQMHESCFQEQLEELEKHIYLCFLNINRSRKLLVQEINME